MCPPCSPSPELMREVVTRYGTALLVQRSLGIDLQKIQRLTKGKELCDLVDNKEYDDLIRESLAIFTQLMGSLEREAARQGHRFATSFTGGPCALCDTCVGPEGSCCHPFQARPSMEAVGIDVIATAESAGMPIRYPATDDPVWTGLLLLE
jgi:predicted metal-binding protein